MRKQPRQSTPQRTTATQQAYGPCACGWGGWHARGGRYIDRQYTRQRHGKHKGDHKERKHKTQRQGVTLLEVGHRHALFCAQEFASIVWNAATHIPSVENKFRTAVWKAQEISRCRICARHVPRRRFLAACVRLQLLVCAFSPWYAHKSGPQSALLCGLVPCNILKSTSPHSQASYYTLPVQPNPSRLHPARKWGQ